jgi:hypothetical protein
MANVDTLVSAGLIVNASRISAGDQATINALSADEITALINVYNTVGVKLLQNNCGTSDIAATATGHALGIVF